MGAYWGDVARASTSGYLRANPGATLNALLDNRAEYALHVGGILILVWLWLTRGAALQTAIAAIAILATGMLAASQNAQLRDMPIAIVIWLLVYGALCRQPVEQAPRNTIGHITALTAALIWPLLAVTAQIATLGGYYRAASRESTSMRVERTNLRGLAVVVEDRTLLETLARTGYTILLRPAPDPGSGSDSPG